MSHFQADSRASVKRPSAPEGNTPGKTAAKIRNVQESENSEARRRCLFGKEENNTDGQSSWTKWTTKEETALVQYICLFWEDAHENKWPTFKNNEFWSGCAEAVMNVCKTTRTGECI